MLTENKFKKNQVHVSCMRKGGKHVATGIMPPVPRERDKKGSISF